MSSRKPSVLVLTSTYPRWPGDTEPGFVHQLNKTLAADFDITVLAPHFRGAKTSEVMDGVQVERFRYQIPVFETLINDGGILANLKANPLKWLLVPFCFLFQIIAIIRIVRKVQPDLVHVHWLILQGLSFWLASMFVNAPPFILTSHGGDLFSFRSGPFLALKKRILQAAASVTVVSSAMKQAVGAMGIDEKKITVAPMGVDFSGIFRERQLHQPASRQLVFVGRLVEKKGLKYLLRILPSVRQEYPDISLKIIGNGPLLPELRAQVKRLGLEDMVIFTGALKPDQVAEELSVSMLFVAPFIQAASGDQEGLGLVTLEAMGMGVPVLVGDVPAVHDITQLKDDNIVDPRNEAEFLSALKRHIDHESRYRKIAREHRQAVIDCWGWDAAGGRYRGLFDNLLLTQIKDPV